MNKDLDLTVEREAALAEYYSSIEFDIMDEIMEDGETREIADVSE